MQFTFQNKDLIMIFDTDESGRVCLRHFGCGGNGDGKEKKDRWCNPVDLHLAGSNQDDHHGAKHTGTCAGDGLKYESHSVFQTENGKQLDLVMRDENVRVTAHYRVYNGISLVRCFTTAENISNEKIGLEYISSFCYYGFDNGCICPDNTMRIYMPHNTWEREFNWRAYTPDELGLERITPFSFKRISASNTGSWTAKEYLPMGAAENLTAQNTMLWQIECNGSWHWEISDLDGRLYLKLSGPTEQENHWYRELDVGESFESVPVSIAVGKDFNEALCSMTKYRRVLFRCDKALPVIFNDYMHCLWANPTEEKMLPIIDRAAQVGCEYYCMDAGWYADGFWWDSVGEWQPCEKRFPHGIKYVFDYIRSKGMVPGIWLEIEVMGIACPILDRFDDSCFFMRHGKRVIDHGRYLLDFRNKKVREYADEVIDRVVREYGVGYIKFDYNIDSGIGTQVDADSFGDGLYRHYLALLDWWQGLRNKYPDLILENCSSGGLRVNYASLSVLQIQSLSDQTKYDKTARIAAGAGTAVLPEQAAVWAYPLGADSNRAVIFNMANAILQRIHLSGEITKWNEEQTELVKQAIDCHKRLRSDTPDAIPFYPLGLPSLNDGFICLGQRTKHSVRFTVWRMNSETGECVIPIDEAVSSVSTVYPNEYKTSAVLTDGGIKVTLNEKLSAAVIEAEI